MGPPRILIDSTSTRTRLPGGRTPSGAWTTGVGAGASVGAGATGAGVSTTGSSDGSGAWLGSSVGSSVGSGVAGTDGTAVGVGVGVGSTAPACDGRVTTSTAIRLAMRARATMPPMMRRLRRTWVDWVDWAERVTGLILLAEMGLDG